MQTTKSLLLVTALGMSFGSQAGKDTMIVFDASGSMWGQIEGKTKIEIAREAIGTISKGFGSDQSVGLMAYGHRRKGDCMDIEYLVNPQKNAAQLISDYVNDLQPKGKTPLSQAVKLAAEKMKYTENAAEVVLITDGVETCDLDPCTMAEELEKLGVDFTAHVIGFGLSADQGKQVACLADLTGGKYVAANDAVGLKDALQQVIIEDKSDQKEFELPEATLQLTAQDVIVGAAFDVAWRGPATEHDYIDVVAVGDDRIYTDLTYAWTKDGQPAQLKAPGKVGQYDLRYIWQGPQTRHILAKATVNVIESEVSIVAPAKVVAGESFSVAWKGPDNDGDYVDLMPAGEQRTFGELSYFYTKAGTPAQIQAPVSAGDYQLRYVLEAPGGREVLYHTPIKVVNSEVSLAFEPAVELADKITVFWTGPNNKDGYIDLVPEGYSATYGELSYFYLKDNPDNGELLAPVAAGNYQIRFVMEGAGGRKVLASNPITVKLVEANIIAPSTAPAGSKVEVQWQGPNRNGDYIDLMPVGNNATSGELAYFYTNNNPEKGMLTIPEQPGEYKIRYVIQGRNRAVLDEKIIVVE
ncbi:MAG: VWA domain-containing protein [Xanthomonadales bacterium]|nr:VWA domain-containing protein [Xanthomonadales bacterium]